MTTSTATGEVGNGGAAEPREHRLPRSARITSGRDIRRIVRSGRAHRGPLVDIFYMASSRGRARIAIVVPRYGHNAVARNRVRRRLSELVRTRWLPGARRDGREIDVVVRAKPAAYGASYERLRESLSEPMEAACAP